ncbi:o-succinylbenzoate synthase [Streptomyces sp. HC44]|uniref:o-succinylbenzoate synthase n=2 Tax=Streptomyces scabichelini TaxID=2711217 RepID=A0A6G4VG75_9ACTN|nr:o-succinylbenzoate synthase [Streptomyces scabichelini]
MAAAFEFARIHRLRMPLVTPFRTSMATETHRELLLLQLRVDGVDGWAECAADPEPLYYAEYIGGVADLLTTRVLPMIGALPRLTSAAVAQCLTGVPGNPLLKAVVSGAVLDAELKRAGMPLADFLGATRSEVPVGVSIGIQPDTGTLLTSVEGYLAEGYQRIKLKIRPGADLEPLRAVRRAFGDDLALQADANQAYTTADVTHLRRFDELGLQMLEQPFPAEQLLAHARLTQVIDTPVCLDESVTGPDSAATALALGAASIVNIKPARVGGYPAARAIHDLCRSQGVPVWCGGVLESGVGRAGNLALAALPGFTFPGDISATRRYFAEDITAPFELTDGHLTVPTGPGLGVSVDLEALRRFTVSTTEVTASSLPAPSPAHQ